MPLPVKYSCLAKKVIRRLVTRGRKKESEKERWLLTKKCRAGHRQGVHVVGPGAEEDAQPGPDDDPLQHQYSTTHPSRVALSGASKEADMPLLPGAEPYSADGGSTGILLIHGFTSSPKSMKPWGERMAAEGHTVRVPRLPGHGTRWQDMNLTRWEDWYAEADRAFLELQSACDAVFVFGLSMGGSPHTPPCRASRRCDSRHRPRQPRRALRTPRSLPAAGAAGCRTVVPRHLQRHQEARPGRGCLRQDPAQGRTLAVEVVEDHQGRHVRGAAAAPALPQRGRPCRRGVQCDVHPSITSRAPTRRRSSYPTRITSPRSTMTPRRSSAAASTSSGA